MHQSGILPLPPHAAFLFLQAGPRAWTDLAHLELSSDLVVGLGPHYLAEHGLDVPGLGPMPTPSGPVGIPSTPTDLFVRIGGADPGEVMHRERALLATLDARVVDRVEAFVHLDSRDLTGYEDGTENPEGDDAVRVAFGPDGSSVVAIQRWVHDFAAFDAHSSAEQDHMMGRDRITNEELDDAPASAHVKRTAQEDFEPEAFVVRRSMAWRDHRGAGLVFVSFAATLDPFEALLRRMCGEDDGIVDGLFGFTRPATGATYWCPGVEDGRLVLARA